RARKARRGIERLEMVHLEDDALDLLGLQVMPGGHLAGQPDDRLVEAGRGIDLELDVEDLPAPAEIGNDLVEVGPERPGEAVRQVAAVASGERVVEASLAFERRRRARPSPSAVPTPAGTMRTPGWVSMWYESHWLLTVMATPLANAAPARVTRAPSTHNVAPCPAPTRPGPRRSCASTARRAASVRAAPKPAMATVTA